MDQVVASGDATSPITFATNSMQIAVPPDNPGRVDSLDDLADPSVKTAVCQPQVPCGVAAEQVFANAGITVSPVTLEPDVKAVLSKVRLDEVDAGHGVRHRRAGGWATRCAGVAIPADVNASTAYPIAGSHGSHEPCDRPGLRRVRPVPRRGVGAHSGRLRPALTAAHAHPDPDPLGSADRAGRTRTSQLEGAPAGIPGLLLVPALVALAFLLLPLIGLVVRAPWGRLATILNEPGVRSALWLSLWTATTATAVSVLIGVPLAWLLARGRFRGRSLLRALVTLPLVLPPVVGGVALLLAFGRRGFVGRLLDDWLGLTLPFTPVAVVMAERSWPCRSW